MNAAAADDDEEEEEHHDDDFDQSKANPFNKGIEQLVDEALRWHDKYVKPIDYDDYELTVPLLLPILFLFFF